MNNVILAAVLASTALFSQYEAVRQGFLKGSLDNVKKSAAVLSVEAAKAKQPAVAKQADAVAKSKDINQARLAFATLSDEMIKVRNASKEKRPAVYYCSMVKKSWLQEKGQVGNPYDSSMQMCGELKAE